MWILPENEFNSCIGFICTIRVCELSSCRGKVKMNEQDFVQGND